MSDRKRLRIFKYSRHRNVLLRWLNFCVVNSRGGARHFLYHFCPTFVCCRDIVVFSTIFMSSCNMVATTTYIFECEKSTYSSRVQKCFYEVVGIIREYDHGSTRAYNMAVATNNRGNIFSFFYGVWKYFVSRSIVFVAALSTRQNSSSTSMERMTLVRCWWVAVEHADNLLSNSGVADPWSGSFPPRSRWDVRKL